MKIHYKQQKNGSYNVASPAGGILRDCYFKELAGDCDRSIISARSHHHSEFEIHIVIKGHQIYETEYENICLSEGEFVIFPPKFKHRSTESDDRMKKYSITFKSDIFETNKAFCGKINSDIINNIAFITSESENDGCFSPMLVHNRIFETVLLLFRIGGFKELKLPKPDMESDERMALAEKYISDNIEHSVTVNDIASYCYLSTKQLTRIFLKYKNTTPAAYINAERMTRIRTLVTESNLTFKEISRNFGFSDECYFNAAFKKHNGMSPGQYRKMHGK